MRVLLLSITFFVSLSSVVLATDPLWNGLETTFSLDGILSWVPFYKSTGYSPVPRTQAEAVSDDWVSLMATPTCENGGLFNGFRYIEMVDNSRDFSVAALYDINGVIAGIQMNILVSQAKAANNTYQFDQISMFLKNSIDSQDVYTLTAYFVDPATICTTGRLATDLTISGTGNVLYFQNGPDATTLIQAPMDRPTALSEGWSDNKCFVGMGVHNWYRQEEFQTTIGPCDFLRPVFLLYTKTNQLLGFGFQHVGKSVAPRFEHPPPAVVKLIVGPLVSPCLMEKAGGIGVTTMHVFLISNPASQTCLPVPTLPNLS